MTSQHILNWTEKIETDESIEEYEFRRYPPNAGGVAMLNTPGEIRFSIESGDIFTHPSRSYLQFEGQILKKDDTAYADADLITIANNGLMFLFSQIRYELGGRDIETLLFPGQITTMAGLLEYTDDFQVSKGLNQCWFKDSEVEFVDGGNTYYQAIASNNNSGFETRRKLIIRKSNPRGSFTFNVPLSHIFGFCKDHQKVLYGLKHELILTRKGDDESIFKTSNTDGGGNDTVADGKIKLNSIYWFVPQIIPSIGFKNSMMEDMAKENVELPIGFDHRQSFSVGLPLGSNTYTWTLTTKSAAEKPRFVIVAFQIKNRDQQKENPAVFDSLNVEEMHFYLNNTKRYPALDFKMDFTSNHYSDAFDAAANFKCLTEGVPSCVSNFGINPIDFKSLYPLFVFDVSKQSAALKSAVVNVNIEMKFKENIVENTKAYVLMLSDKKFLLKPDGSKLQVVF